METRSFVGESAAWVALKTTSEEDEHTDRWTGSATLTLTFLLLDPKLCWEPVCHPSPGTCDHTCDHTNSSQLLGPLGPQVPAPMGLGATDQGFSDHMALAKQSHRNFCLTARLF